MISVQLLSDEPVDGEAFDKLLTDIATLYYGDVEINGGSTRDGRGICYICSICATHSIGMQIAREVRAKLQAKGVFTNIQKINFTREKSDPS